MTFDSELDRLLAHFDRQLNHDALRNWREKFQDVDSRVLHAAISDLIESSRAFPTMRDVEDKIRKFLQENRSGRQEGVSGCERCRDGFITTIRSSYYPSGKVDWHEYLWRCGHCRSSNANIPFLEIDHAGNLFTVLGDWISESQPDGPAVPVYHPTETRCPLHHDTLRDLHALREHFNATGQVAQDLLKSLSRTLGFPFDARSLFGADSSGLSWASGDLTWRWKKSELELPDNA